MNSNIDSLESKFPKFYVNHIRPTIQNVISKRNSFVQPSLVCKKKSISNFILGSILFTSAFFSFDSSISSGVVDTFSNEEKQSYYSLLAQGNNRDAKQMFKSQKKGNYYAISPFNSKKSTKYACVGFLLTGLSLASFSRSAKWNEANIFYQQNPDLIKDNFIKVNPSVGLCSFNSNYGKDSRVTTPYISTLIQTS